MINEAATGVPQDAQYGTVGPEIRIGDIERICEECNERERPPEIFVLSSKSMSNALLAVKVEFLEDGQLLGCPGLPLVGAVFDPDWGFARAEVESRALQPAEFRVPKGHPNTFTSGDTWGYRLCPIDNHEIPDLIRELARIRVELAKPRNKPNGERGVAVTLTEL
jgi:hypothetical protein